jgi:predicted metal-dependent HD superfamily phosphohydrolase
MRITLRPEHRQELVTRYSEPHRHYHNLEHISMLFATAAGHGIRLSVPQMLAIWYHDAIYDPTMKDNEEKSNQLFLAHHAGTLIKDYTVRVSNIIIDTKYHRSDDHESQVILDLDLCGFGYDYDTFKYTTSLIRKEYNHLPEEVWVANRKLFLESMLNRNYIFHTNWGRDYYEIKARKNIEKELLTLDK